ncbi:multiple epidermal growth factor-like domains protein 10 [Mercenaria mercenaria]|uniref:multiple epidermal growth factor-like domains protein 10 n=1 Tax=Mercenaria mercenaria TaxID=6596 RepID=UPI00234EC087|nr:multiple epidermal growth factor-like domains protein 10 [Mercenaria mercenaria]
MAILFFSWFLVQIALTTGDCPRHCFISSSSRSTCCTCGHEWVTTKCIDKCLNVKDCHSCFGHPSTWYDEDIILNCSRCHEYVNHSTGECKSCPDGCVSCFDGTFCYECINGLYGNNCNKKCGNCIPSSLGVVKCNRGTGKCSGCVNGYYSPRCDRVCGHCLPNDFNVVKCHRYTGYCDKGCIDSYFGRRCDQKCGKCLPDDKGAVKCDKDTGSCFSGCIPGFFGKACDNKCSGNCLDSSIKTDVCDIISGKCLYGCVSGRYGDTCNETCSDTCSKRACSRKAGFCDNGCVQGWYGDSCNKPCSDTCSKRACSRQSGFCDNGCVQGWYGDTCNITCSDMCSLSFCNQNSGFCEKGCVSGWYGDSCKESCSSTCYDKTCDQYSGYCYNGCASTYYGDTCEFNCVVTCKERDCDRETSQCLRGCVTGFQGAFCNITMETGTDSVLVSIAGSLVGAIILLVFGLIVWLLRRVLLKDKRYDNLQMSTRNTAASIYDEIRATRDKTEERRVSESHSYTEIDGALPMSIHESRSNSFDDDFAGNSSSTLATVENIEGTPPFCANALNMSALQSEDNKDNKSDGNETQISSFISSAEVHRKGSNRSRKYYEIPDIVPGVNHKVESNHTIESYEIPLSNASTRFRKAQVPEAGNANLSRQCNIKTDVATSQRRDSKKPQKKQLMSKRNKEKDANDINPTPQKFKDDKCNINPSRFNMEMQFKTRQMQEEIHKRDSDSLNYIHPVN